MKKEKLIKSIGQIDEKFILEASGKMKKSSSAKRAWKAVASFVIIVGLALFLFLPTNPGQRDVSSYSDSEYYPLIKKLEPYRSDATALPYDNNFELIGMILESLFVFTQQGGVDFAPTNPEDEMMAGGEYVETTDNQVSGIVEADIIKTTTTHLFHLAGGDTLRVYSLDGKNTAKVGERDIAFSLDGKMVSGAEMYLTADGETAIVIADYLTRSNDRRVGVLFFSVKHPAQPILMGTLLIDGSYNTSRLVGDKLLLVSEYYFDPDEVDYDDPKTFVPTVTRDGVDSLLTMDEILAPDGVNASRYSVVTAIDVKNYEITGANGLLNFTNSVYVSENNVYVTRSYTETESESSSSKSETMTDIAVLGYTDGSLQRQVITISGTVLNQYSMDERDGHLRVVTSTNKRVFEQGSGIAIESADLYVVNLKSGETVASVENFAPNGEEVASVRFDGDKLYVCTAVVITYTDPVFFFDLSDYSNITYTDTGVIDGYSTSLINLGEGFLLGIGMEGWNSSKIEVYEEQAGQVVSVATFEYNGRHSENYKDYLVNREENLFGFNIYGDSRYGTVYVLLQFDGYELNVVTMIGHSYSATEGIRGIIRDGYLYVVTNNGVIVADLSVPYGEDGHIVAQVRAYR